MSGLVVVFYNSQMESFIINQMEKYETINLQECFVFLPLSNNFNTFFTSLRTIYTVVISFSCYFVII